MTAFRKAAGIIRRLARGVKYALKIRTLRNGIKLLKTQGLRAFLSIVLFKLRGNPSSNYMGMDHQQKGNHILELQQKEFSSKYVLDEIERFKHKPLISVILIRSDSTPKWFDITVKSLQSQIYINWELCIISNNDGDSDVDEGMKRAAEHDNRILLPAIKNTCSISTALNKALEIIRGEFVAALNCDGELTRDALFWMAKEINEHSDADFIYSDECKVDHGKNRKYDFCFKPDWSQLLLASFMYTGNLAICKTTLVRQLGGFRNHYDFSRDYDLALRISDSAGNIRHVERVLYFSRETLESSTAVEKKRKTRISALKDWYKRNDIDAVVSEHYKQNEARPILSKDLMVSIIIPSDNYENVVQCVRNLCDNTPYPDFEIIIISDSTLADQLLQEFRLLENLKIFRSDKPFNFSARCNAGALMATGDILVFLMDTISPTEPGWLTNLSGCLSFPGVAAVSPKIIRKDNTIKYAGIAAGGFGFGAIMFNGEPNIIGREYSSLIFSKREVSILSSSCIAIKKTTFNAIAGFNEESTPEKYSNIDLSMKIALHGKKCVYCGFAELMECGEEWYDNWILSNNETGYSYILQRYAHMLEQDPYFTKSMKLYMLKGVPLEYRIYAGKKVIRDRHPKRKILFISHDLSLTGAPIVLLSAAKAIVSEDDYGAMISFNDGPLAESVTQSGIDVIFDNTILSDERRFVAICESFDLVFVSTLVCYKAIEYLSPTKIPVIWWVHESKESYKLGAKELLPEAIGTNINVYCGGAYAQKLLQQSRPCYSPNILLYGMPDITKKEEKQSYVKYKTPERLLFIIVGTVEYRKGQDIFAKAVLDLPEEIAKSVDFLVIGRKIHNNIYQHLIKLKKKYPDNVTLVDEVSRDELNVIYSSCDFVVCASRDDPMPVFTIEGMMFSKICICSENTGTASFIEDKINGFVYYNDDYKQLSKKIQYVIAHHDELDSVKQRSRRIYDEHFSMNMFNRNINDVVESALRRTDGN